MVLSKHRLETLLKQPSLFVIEEWFSRKAGSKEFVSWYTINGYIEDILQFIHFSGYQDADKYINDFKDKPEELINSINNWINGMNKKNNAPATQIKRVASIKRWLILNKVKLDWQHDWQQIILPKKRYVIQDKAPTKIELRKLLMFSPLWLKVSIMVMATSGIRIGALINLKIKDIDLIKDEQIGFITVPPELSKTRIGYFTFFTPESKEIINQYLNHRKKTGEIINSESPLIRSPQTKNKPAYYTINIAYRRALRRAELTEKSRDRYILHTHTLRKWFRTQLEGVMTRSQIERLMGHSSSEYLDGSYFRPPEKELLETYRRAIPNLTILEDIASEDFQKQMLLKQASLFISDEKLRILKDILARSKSFDEGVEEFRKLRDNTESKMNTKIIQGEQDLQHYTEEGWDIIKELKDDRFLVRLK